METKYLAKTDYCALGSVHPTEEQAAQQSTLYRDWNDEVSGYYDVFGEHSTEPYPVITIEDKCPTAAEYIEAMKECEEVKKQLEEEIKQLKAKRLGKYWDITRRYVNLGTNYNHHDLVEVTYRRNGRKRRVRGIVYDVWITEQGEIRPKIGKINDKPEDELLSVKVIKPRNEMTAREIFRILHRIDII